MVAVSADGGIYVSEQFAGRVIRIGDAPPAGRDARYPLVGALSGAAAAYALRRRMVYCLQR